MPVNPHRRLRCENVDIKLNVGESHHKLTVAFAYDSVGILRELNFVSRTKAGHGLDDLLRELGIKLSRAIQGRDPNTGLDQIPLEEDNRHLIKRRPGVAGENHPQAKFTNEEIKRIRSMFYEGYRPKAIMREFPQLTSRNLYCIMNELTWKNLDEVETAD